MRIIMHAESDLTLTDFDEPDFIVDADESVDAPYDAMQMFATSLGVCTASILATYGARFDTDISDMVVRLQWDYVEDPYRIGDIDMDIEWPSLPDDRLDAAERVAEQCTIHNTLHHPPEVDTRVVKGEDLSSGARTF